MLGPNALTNPSSQKYQPTLWFYINCNLNHTQLYFVYPPTLMHILLHHKLITSVSNHIPNIINESMKKDSSTWGHIQSPTDQKLSALSHLVQLPWQLPLQVELPGYKLNTALSSTRSFVKTSESKVIIILGNACVFFFLFSIPTKLFWL